MLRLLACAAALACTAGCATVIRGTQQDFAIQSTPPGATASLSTGQSCVTPCSLRLPRKEDFDVSFSMDGYDSGTAHVTSGWSRAGTQTFVIGNIILGGLVGMGVDASSGATRDLWPNPLVVTLVPSGQTAGASAEVAEAETAEPGPTAITQAPAQPAQSN
jgi:hypothetical protein